MSNKWIKKGDRVVVLTGNSKGVAGEVLKRTTDRIVVHGVNIRKKHLKAQSQAAAKGIIDIECPLHISNVALCDAENKPVKPKLRMHSDGKREVVYIDSHGKEVVHREIRKPSKV